MSAIQERSGLSFQETIHQDGGIFEHPYLARREAEIRGTFIPQLDALKKDPRIQDIARNYPDLVPNEADQGLILTPYDEYDGMEVCVPSDEAIEGWRRLRMANLILANHPARIAAMMELEKKGFKPPEKKTGVIDKFLNRGITP